jgi:hypothetical protein
LVGSCQVPLNVELPQRGKPGPPGAEPALLSNDLRL